MTQQPNSEFADRSDRPRDWQESDGSASNSESDLNVALERYEDQNWLFQQLSSLEPIGLSVKLTSPECETLMSKLQDLTFVRSIVDRLENQEVFPKNFGRYELLGQLGMGGMGRVYRARNLRLGKIQAIKIIRQDLAADAQCTARFLQEAQVLGELNHPNIVAAQDVDEFEGIPFLVMDFVTGRNLAEWISALRLRGLVLSVGTACEIVRQAALGMDYVHKKGILHRDLKPSNLMIDESGAVRVMDLGLARFVRPTNGEATPELTGHGQFVGTREFVSPEQLRNATRVDVRTDVYSLAATLYTALAGQAPFPAIASESPWEHGIQILNMTAPKIRDSRPDTPAELAEIIDRCLAKTLEVRLASARDLADELRKWAAPDAVKRLATIEPVAITSADTELVYPTLEQESARPMMVSKKTVALVQEPTVATGSNSVSRHWSRGWLIALGWLFFAGILGILIRLQLPNGGELIIQCDDPNAKISIVAEADGDSKQLALEQLSATDFKLSAGTWRITLSGLDADKFEVSENEVTISNGRETTIVITRREKDLSNLPHAVAPEIAPLGELRRVAARILDAWPEGGNFIQFSDPGHRLEELEVGPLRTATFTTELPETDWSIYAVSVLENRTKDATLLRDLFAIQTLERITLGPIASPDEILKLEKFPPKLHYFWCNGGMLNRSAFERLFSHCPDLYEIRITNRSGVDTEWLPSFSQLAELRFLYLNDTNLSDEELLDCVLSSPKLYYFNASGTAFSSNSLLALGQHPNLNQIVIANCTNINAEAVAEFRKLYPNCSVILEFED